MAPADWIQLVIAVFTAAAAIAAWLSARASRESVKAQEVAADESRKQVDALSAQVAALNRHAETALSQAQAEAIRWSAWAHLELVSRRLEIGNSIESLFAVRLPIAQAEFALFRSGLFPRDFYLRSILRHLGQGSFDALREQWGAPLPEPLLDRGELQNFQELWAEINRLLAEAPPGSPRSNTQPPEERKKEEEERDWKRADATKQALDKICPQSTATAQ